MISRIREEISVVAISMVLVSPPGRLRNSAEFDGSSRDFMFTAAESGGECSRADGMVWF